MVEIWHTQRMFQEFVEAIDGIDNGINQYGKEVKALYRSRTDLSSRVGHLNPAWNEPSNPEVYDVVTINAEPRISS